MSRTGRRTAKLVLAAVLLFTLTPLVFGLLGDVDDDGQITTADAQMVLETVVGIRTLSPTEEAAADVDGNGAVDVADAQWIAQFASGAVTAFPERLPQHSGPIAASRKGDRVAVVDPDGGTVVFLATAGDTVEAMVDVGREPTSVAFSRDGRTAFVTVARDRSVAVVDVAAGAVVGAIDVGVEPFGIVIDFRGSRAYVSNAASGTVSVIDVASRAVVGTVPVASQPQGLATTADSSKVYVTHLKPGETELTMQEIEESSTRIPPRMLQNNQVFEF